MWLAAGWLLLAVAFAATAATHGDKADEYVARAKSKARIGDFRGAISDFTKAIKLKPGDAEAYVGRGVAKMLTDCVYLVGGICWGHEHTLYVAADDPIMDFTMAIRLNPGYAEAYFRRALAAFDRADVARGIKGYEEVDVAGYRADAAHEIEDFTKAIQLKPDFVVAYVGRGIARLDAGDSDGAIEDYNMASRIDSRSAKESGEYISPAFFKRGTARLAKGDSDGAIGDFTKAIELKPDYGEAYSARGNAKQAKGDEAGSHFDLAKAAALRASPPPSPRK